MNGWQNMLPTTTQFCTEDAESRKTQRRVKQDVPCLALQCPCSTQQVREPTAATQEEPGDISRHPERPGTGPVSVTERRGANQCRRAIKWQNPACRLKRAEV